MGTPSEVGGVLAVQTQLVQAGAAPAGECMLVLGPPGTEASAPTWMLLCGWAAHTAQPNCLDDTGAQCTALLTSYTSQ